MIKYFIMIMLMWSCDYVAAQNVMNRKQFFIGETPVEATLTTDIRKLVDNKQVVAWQAAELKLKFDDTLEITGSIKLQPRGVFRKNNCDMASLMFDFKNSSSKILAPLKKLKFVGGCKEGNFDEELLLKEYLVYKIYNIISNMSLRVRLLHVKYEDSKKKLKLYSQYAFLIEDAKDMAERNNCIDLKADYFTSETTNRDQMTLVNLFQYMIGNCDWAVAKQHNIKLIAPKNDTLAMPFVVPYDFDYCGLVEAPYAEPQAELGIKSVTERVYRGYPRTAEELNAAIQVFEEKKSMLIYLVKNFSLLDIDVRNKMINYIEEFYKTIANKKKVNSIFIKKAGTQ